MPKRDEYIFGLCDIGHDLDRDCGFQFMAVSREVVDGADTRMCKACHRWFVQGSPVWDEYGECECGRLSRKFEIVYPTNGGETEVVCPSCYDALGPMIDPEYYR